MVGIFISALWKRGLSLEPLTNCTPAHWVTSLRYRAWDGNIILDYLNGSEVKSILKRGREGDFPSSLVAKTSASNARGASSILAKELKSHMWPKSRTWNSGNIVTNSVKIFIFKGRIQDTGNRYMYCWGWSRTGTKTSNKSDNRSADIYRGLNFSAYLLTCPAHHPRVSRHYETGAVIRLWQTWTWGSQRLRNFASLHSLWVVESALRLSPKSSKDDARITLAQGVRLQTDSKTTNLSLPTDSRGLFP